MSKKNQGAIISDLRDINRILKHVHKKESKIKYGHLGDKDDLVLNGLREASYKQDGKEIGGVILLLANSSFTKASPIYWKSNHSSKDAQTLNLIKMVYDAVLTSRHLELLLYREIMNRIPVYLFTHSESMLESIASTKQITTKTPRNAITHLKHRLVDEEIASYAWLPTNSLWADILTKEKRMPSTFGDVNAKNNLYLGDTTINKVKAFGQEVWMTNIHNRLQ